MVLIMLMLYAMIVPLIVVASLGLFCLCRAIADTPFPFPWAQMVLIMLMLYALTVPLMVVAFVDSTWMGCLINFFCVQSYWCLNEVARDLEDPFVYDPNDLPLARYQVRRPLPHVLHGTWKTRLCMT